MVSIIIIFILIDNWIHVLFAHRTVPPAAAAPPPPLRPVQVLVKSTCIYKMTALATLSGYNRISLAVGTRSYF